MSVVSHSEKRITAGVALLFVDCFLAAWAAAKKLNLHVNVEKPAIVAVKYFRSLLAPHSLTEFLEQQFR